MPKHFIVLDCKWSDHVPVLLHKSKLGYGPTPFQIFHSWFHRDGFEETMNNAFLDFICDSEGVGVKLELKLKSLKEWLKEWNRES